MSDTVSILLVDDHPVFRLGLRNLLDGVPDLVVVGEASDGFEAARLVEELEPTVVVMDIAMPGLNGVESTRRILERRPTTRVLIVTMFDDDSVFDAVKAGALGYILKGADPEETIRAIRCVANGEAIFGPNTARRLSSFFARSKAATPFPELTEREQQVLQRIARGLTNSAIADELYLSEKTVRNHVSNVFAKLHVASRAEAVARARDAGMR